MSRNAFTRRQFGARPADVIGLTALAAFLFCVIQPNDVPDPLGLGPGSSWTALCCTFAIPVLVIQLARHVRISLTPFDYLLFAYVAVVLITWPTGYDRQAGLKAIGALLGQIGVFYAVRLLLADSLFPSHLIVTVLVVGIAVLQLMAIGSHLEHGLFNRLIGYASPRGWGGRPEVSFLAAIEFALLLGIRLRSRPRTFQLAFFCLVLSIVVELIFLYSRLAWIAASAALVAYGLVTIRTVGARWYALTLACVALLAVSLFIRDPALSRVAESMVGAGQVQATPEMRFVLWRRTARMIRDHPLLGVGLGNFQAPFVPYYNPEEPNDDQRPGVHSHNLFLHQAAEVGVPGGLIYAALWSVGLFAGWKEETGRPLSPCPPAGAFYALIVFAVAGFGENMFLDTVAPPRARLHSVAWLLLALTVAEWNRRLVARAESSLREPAAIATSRVG